MHEFQEGDRVRYVGKVWLGSDERSFGTTDLMPGELGWVIDIYRPAGVCVVSWDRHETVNMGDPRDLEWLGENEPDPMRRVPDQ